VNDGVRVKLGRWAGSCTSTSEEPPNPSGGWPEARSVLAGSRAARVSRVTFADGSGGLITFEAESTAHAGAMVAECPFIREGLLEHRAITAWYAARVHQDCRRGAAPARAGRSQSTLSGSPRPGRATGRATGRQRRREEDERRLAPSAIPHFWAA
jgi:hypothetical protein